VSARLSLLLAGCLLACSTVDETGGALALEMAFERAGTVKDLQVDAPLPTTGLPPHRATMRVVYRLGTGSDRSVLDVKRVVDRGDGGSFRVDDRRTWFEPKGPADGVTDGHEARFDGHRLASRRKWAPWITRGIVAGEHHVLLRAAYDGAPTVLGALAGYLTWEPDGRETLLGAVDVGWERVGRDPDVAPAPLDEVTLRALRDHEDHWGSWLAATHAPSVVTGRLARLPGSREVVSGELEIQGIAHLPQGRRPFTLSVTYGLAPPSGTISFEAPENALEAKRARPWKMIESALGEDLLPVYRRGP